MKANVGFSSKIVKFWLINAEIIKKTNDFCHRMIRILEKMTIFAAIKQL